MKLTLTVTEATPHLVRTLGLPEGTEVTITETETVATDATVAAQLRILVRRAVRDVDALNPRPESKIPAIKLLREFTPYGLAESKWCIENWEAFKQFVEDNGRFPVLKYRTNYSTFSYLMT